MYKQGTYFKIFLNHLYSGEVNISYRVRLQVTDSRIRQVSVKKNTPSGPKPSTKPNEMSDNRNNIPKMGNSVHGNFTVNTVDDMAQKMWNKSIRSQEPIYAYPFEIRKSSIKPPAEEVLSKTTNIITTHQY